MGSERQQEGYLIVDHRYSPGVPDWMVQQARAAGKDVLGAGASQTVESATYTCSHCHAIVVLNPDRSRARAWCGGCDHRICDACEFRRVNLGQGCVPLARVFDQLQTQASRLLTL